MVITDENVVEVATYAYKNEHCLGMEEFESDFRLFALLSKYLSSKMNVGLVLNTIIAIMNVFDNKVAFHLIMFHTKSKNYAKLKPFLSLLSLLPKHSYLNKIKDDKDVIKHLREY